jgi:tetratricopeptide (TPR) repeat protein
VSHSGFLPAIRGSAAPKIPSGVAARGFLCAAGLRAIQRSSHSNRIGGQDLCQCYVEQRSGRNYGASARWFRQRRAGGAHGGSGEVQFVVLSGEHSLRVFGRGIEEYKSSLEILPVELHKTENVVVRSTKEAGGEGKEKGGDGPVTPNSLTVPIHRLNVPDKARQEFAKGSGALRHKDWPEAKKRFAAAIAIFPDYDLAYNGLADAAMATGDTASARAALEKAISLNKNFAEAYRNLALVAFAEHNYEEANTLLLQALAIDPLNARALTYAANAELLTHKYNEAIAHARKAHALPHEGLAGAHIVAARACEATNQPEEAVKEYRLYLDEDPQGRDANIARAAITRLGSASK